MSEVNTGKADIGLRDAHLTQLVIIRRALQYIRSE
jgi:hypothetical protein